MTLVAENNARLDQRVTPKHLILRSSMLPPFRLNSSIRITTCILEAIWKHTPIEYDEYAKKQKVNSQKKASTGRERHCSCLCYHLQTAFERVMAAAAIRRFETGISSSAHREEPTLNVAIGASQAMGSRRRQNHAHQLCTKSKVIFAGAEQAAPEELCAFDRHRHQMNSVGY
jgi:hypothetical protein